MSIQRNTDNSREKTIIRTSIIGISANVFLATFKAIIGLFTGSIAIILDSVNNSTDSFVDENPVTPVANTSGIKFTENGEIDW